MKIRQFYIHDIHKNWNEVYLFFAFSAITYINATAWSNTFDKSIFMGFDYYIFHSSPPFSSKLSQHIDDQQNFCKDCSEKTNQILKCTITYVKVKKNKRFKEITK